MSQYYYSENNKQFGPFSLEDIRAKKIKSDFLVWTESLINWTKADQIEELKGFLITKPPPLPLTSNIANTVIIKPPKLPTSLIDHPVYDLTYKKETNASIIGGTLFLINFFLTLRYISFKNEISELMQNNNYSRAEEVANNFPIFNFDISGEAQIFYFFAGLFFKDVINLLGSKYCKASK